MKMGLNMATLKGVSNKCSDTNGPECTKCERLVIDGLMQTKYETFQKILKELFGIQWLRNLENISKEDENQLEVNCFQKADFQENFAKSPMGHKEKCILEESTKVLGAMKTYVSNDEAAILIYGWLPNLTGNADILRANLNLNFDRTVNSKISYQWPVHGYNVKPILNLALSCQNKKPTDLGFQVNEQSISCGVSFQSYQNIKQFLNWESALRHQIGYGHMSLMARANCGYSLKSSLKHTTVFDDRNSALFPTKGNQVKFVTEVSGLGGNVYYLKNNLQMQHIFPLPRDLILETTFGCGLLNPFNCISKYVDTFTLGGPMSVRGFQTNGIDPKNDCVSSYWVGNIHLYLPFIMKSQNCRGNFEHNYRTQFFINSGNLGSGNNCLKKEITDLTHGFRISCGVGLIVSIKELGRIEVNYCIPLQHQKDDRTVTGLQFGIHFDFL